MILARFMARYGSVYHSAHWPTRDGVVPFRLFYLLGAALGTLDYQEQVRIADGVSLGAAMMWSGKSDTKLQSHYRDLQRLAWPRAHG